MSLNSILFSLVLGCGIHGANAAGLPEGRDLLSRELNALKPSGRNASDARI